MTRTKLLLCGDSEMPSSRGFTVTIMTSLLVVASCCFGSSFVLIKEHQAAAVVAPSKGSSELEKRALNDLIHYIQNAVGFPSSAAQTCLPINVPSYYAWTGAHRHWPAMRLRIV